MVIPLKSYRNTFVILGILLGVIGLINISLGSVHIPLKQIIMALFDGSMEKESWRTIVLNYRLPKAITAIIVGSGLSISG